MTRLTGLTIVAIIIALGSLSSCNRAPVINVEETIRVSDSPQTLSAPAINIVETIGVGDSPSSTQSSGIELTEDVGVTDSTRLTESILLSIMETIHVSDSSVLTQSPVQPEPPPIKISVTVTSPKTGEVWHVGIAHSIAWTTTGEGIDHVDIYYSTDGGKSMIAVSKGELNDGNYTWKVPNTASKMALVRVLAFGTKGETLTLGDSGLFSISVQ
jgi:hypothetical protein